ncbi:hypothetical protein AS888_07365 [Peribacillus simplex]|uniref:Uncharacterized protein n=1 Tax=Peribacillus simplex TaxID=1478 RepID=A0A109MVD3_9BACI|nr:hypothetical protein [Peribacillus simplex]KWW16215.1 hypothetical protein AS888_07365 [Peribacillus simplex]
MSYLGEYLNMPPTIDKLHTLKKEIEKEGYSLSDLSLYLEFDFSPYETTLYDVITFASTGVDGIHFGFLTDFGRVSDLENAFVVCISPMDFDTHIKIVARNIREYLSLVCTMKDALSISNFNIFEEEEQYIQYLQEQNQVKPEDKEFEEEAKYVVEKILDAFGSESIEDVYHYVEIKVREQRAQQTIFPTLDGLGIIPVDNVTSSHILYKLEKDMTIDLAEMKAFFYSATTESKLAFIRDVQFTYLITNGIALKELVIQEMIKLGLQDEVDRLYVF